MLRHSLSRILFGLPAFLCIVSCTHQGSDALRQELAERPELVLATMTYHEPSLSIRDFAGHDLNIRADCCDVSEHQSIQRNTVAVMDWTTGSEALSHASASSFWQKFSGQIVLLDAGGNQLKRSTLLVSLRLISAAPDLERFAFVGNPLHPTDVGQYGLYVTRFDDDQLILLSDLAGISRSDESLDSRAALDWSPDGSNLLLSANGKIRRLSLETNEIQDGAWVSLGSYGTTYPTPDGLRFPRKSLTRRADTNEDSLRSKRSVIYRCCKDRHRWHQSANLQSAHSPLCLRPREADQREFPL